MSIKTITICALILAFGATASFAGDLYVPGVYGTIQAAVDAAVGGDVIHVAAGTYTEQVHIATSDITIDGVGVGSTVIASPVTLTAYFTTSSNNYPVVFIDGVTGVALSNLTVDGANQGSTNNKFIGVGFWNGGGSMTDMEVLNVMDSTFSGAQHGVGVYSYNDTGGPYAITMTDVLVDDYQKNALALSGEGLTVDLTRVVTVGQGDTDVTAQNGIQIGYGASGTVTDCEVYGNSWIGDTWTASGLLIYAAGTVDVDGSLCDGNQTSVYFESCDGSFDNGSVVNPVGDALYVWGIGGARADNRPRPEASPYGDENPRFGGRASASVSCTGSTFTGTDLTDSWGPSGLGYSGGTVVLTLTDCDVSHWDYGIVNYEYDAADDATTTVHGCSITDNTSYGYYSNSEAEQDAERNWWGDPDGPTTAKAGGAVGGLVKVSPWYAAPPGTTPMVWGTNSSIQDAIDAASSGDAISVDAGTYREQLRIDGKSLDLSGAGIGVTILEAVDVVDRTTYSVTQWTGSARTIDACIGVTSAGTVSISDMTIDGRELGPDNFYGVHFFDTNCSLTDCVVEDVTYASSPGAQRVVSVAATHGTGGTPFTVDFSDNVIPNMQKGGLLVMGPDMTFTCNGNEITNAPSGDNAGNGIQLLYGASGTTSGNVVHGVAYTGSDWSATGILLFESGDISMTGDIVTGCQSGVNFSDWGWVYLHPSTVSLSFTDVYLDGNDWALGCQLSRDGSALDFDADGCVILDSAGDGIDLFGTGQDPWGGSYYTGWENGSLIADINDCVVTGTAVDGIWIDDLSGNLTNTMDIEVHYTALDGSVGSGIWNGATHLVDAEYCWWGDPAGPTVIPGPARGNRPAVGDVSPYSPGDLPERGEPRFVESSASRAGVGVYGNVDYDPWLGGNIVCYPDPEYLTSTDPVETIDVNYLGGGSGLMYGYSVKFTWDAAIVSTPNPPTSLSILEGSLLSDIDNTFFFPRMTGANEITVDCAILGDFDGATGPGTMFSVEFTGLAVGTSDVDITVDRIRDKDNATLTGFYADDGLLIVDVDDPVVADVLITNSTLTHTNDYIKDGDTAVVTATVTDDGGLTGADIVADLSGFGVVGLQNPDDYTGGVATWTVTGVTCTPTNGLVTVTVTATDGIGNTASGSDTITADNTAPTAVTGFDAAPGHEECALTWTNGTDNYSVDGVVVQRDAVALEYPQYPFFVGNWPAVDAGYPGNEIAGTNVYNGTGTSHTDGVVDRNIYYYQAFCYDIARNYGPAATTARDLATNYWLGDFVDTWGSGFSGLYDGNVDDYDILALSDAYGDVDPMADPGDAECDIGPTVHPDWHRLGLPLCDDKVEFEDLMVVAMNYGVVAPRVVPFLPETYDPTPLAMSLGGGESRGEDVAIALRLDGNIDEVKGLSAVISYNTNELEFVSARLTDDMTSPLGNVFFWHGETDGSVTVDMAVLGTGVSVGGSGEVAVLTFRQVADGYSLSVESARLRDVNNDALDARLGEFASDAGAPLVFRLVGNTPNPFNPVTKVAYHVPRESEVAIRVYDVSGRLVRTLVDGLVEPGRHVAVWDGLNEGGSATGSGVYFCTMEAPDFHESMKMTLLK